MLTGLSFRSGNGRVLPGCDRWTRPEIPSSIGSIRPTGGRLVALGCELVWATSWLADANEIISPRLALPELPVVEWPDDDADPAAGVHWKTAGLTRWATGRVFIWLDDEITDRDRRWVAAHHPHPALLHRVDPDQGLTAADYEKVRGWLEKNRDGS
jgi:hypothetical protein